MFKSEKAAIFDELHRENIRAISSGSDIFVHKKDIQKALQCLSNADELLFWPQRFFDYGYSQSQEKQLWKIHNRERDMAKKICSNMAIEKTYVSFSGQDGMLYSLKGRSDLNVSVLLKLKPDEFLSDEVVDDVMTAVSNETKELHSVKVTISDTTGKVAIIK